MSRSNHDKNARLGEDFGSRYNCNRHYGAGTGKDAKDRADSERRNQGKKIIQADIRDTFTICPKCGWGYRTEKYSKCPTMECGSNEQD